MISKSEIKKEWLETIYFVIQVVNLITEKQIRFKCELFLLWIKVSFKAIKTY